MTERFATDPMRAAKLKADLLACKELRVLDKTKLKGQFRSFLADQFLPLSDAQDALGFDPPHIEAALQRLHMVMSAITKKLEES